jgi:hypothetical protein
MSYNHYQNELNKIDRSVSRMFLGLTITVSSLVIMSSGYYLLNVNSKEEMSGINEVTNKVDTVLINQSLIGDNLTLINQKLDEGLGNNEMVMDSIVTIKNGVSKINYSVGKVSKNIDTIVLYVKK